MSVPAIIQSGRRRRRGPQPMSIELLQLSAPRGENTHTFHADVETLTAKYSDVKIRRRLNHLLKQGFLTNHGSPRLGWLTDKGRDALEGRRLS